MINLKFLRKVRLFCVGLALLLGFHSLLVGLVEAAPPLPPTLPPLVSSPSTTNLPKPTLPPKTTPTTQPRITPSATPGLAQPKLVTQPPTLNSTSAIAVDADTGRILFTKEAHRQLPMASTTKIMTALTLLSVPEIDLNAETLVVQEDLVGEANMQLKNGERIKLLSLLIGLLTNSANEAGMTLARYVGARIPGPADPISRFVALMNSKALALGMFDSHYMNPHGLDQSGHYSSAYDLAISGWYALHHPTIKSIIRLDTYNFEGHDFYNVNNFIRRYPGATGIKPGWTDDAGRCLIASATNYGHTVIGVILNAPYDSVAADIDTLMDYSFSLLTNQAQPQLDLSGPSAYIGLPEGDRLAPFDTKPLVEFFRGLGLNLGQWLQLLQQSKK